VSEYKAVVDEHQRCRPNVTSPATVKAGGVYKMLDESSIDSDFSAVYAYVSSIFSIWTFVAHRNRPLHLRDLA